MPMVQFVSPMASLLKSARPFAFASQTLGSRKVVSVRAMGGNTGATVSSKEGAVDFIKTTNANNKVVVWSKSYCPYCAKAKATMAKLLKPSDYLVIEIENRPDMDLIQDAMLDITKGRSVPRVFVGGQFIGGGDDTVAKANSGELQKLLKGQGLTLAA